MLLSISKKSTAPIGIGGSIGVLQAGIRDTSYDLTIDQLEHLRPALVALQAAGVISWTTSPSPNIADNGAEGASVALTNSGLSVPAAPVIRTPGGVMIGEVIIWNNVPSAESYDLYLDGVLAQRNVLSPFTISADENGPPVQIAAVNESGSSLLSNSVQFNPRNFITPNRTEVGVNTFVESFASNNVAPSNSVTTLKSQTIPGFDISAPAPTNRPTLVASPMIGGLKTCVFDGVDDYLVTAATANRPKTWLIVQRILTANPNFPIAAYGTAYPYVAKGDAGFGSVKYFFSGTGSLQAFPAADDGYYRLIVATDDGANPRLTIYNSTFNGIDQTITIADAGARSASPGALSLGALPNGTLPTDNDIALALMSDQAISAQQEASFLAYCRWVFITQQTPIMPFVGTRKTLAGAQPGPYPFYHEGESGDTVAAWAQRMVGYWSNGVDFTLGSAGDPGPGNRGAIEALVNSGNTSLVLFVLIGANDATGVIPGSSVQMALRRAFAIAQGSLKLVQWATQTELNGAVVGGLVNANIVTYNTAIPGWVATLVSEGYNVVTCPINTGYVPATMARADNVHPNLSGCQHCGNIIADQITALGYYLPTNQYCMSGHSEVEGGLNLTPQATAQLRNWTAYYLVNP